MMPRIASRKAYDEMLDKKNKTIADLLEALEAINPVLAIWLIDPSKAPNTLVASINAIIEPAIEKAKEVNGN